MKTLKILAGLLTGGFVLKKAVLEGPGTSDFRQQGKVIEVPLQFEDRRKELASKNPLSHKMLKAPRSEAEQLFQTQFIDHYNAGTAPVSKYLEYHPKLSQSTGEMYELFNSDNYVAMYLATLQFGTPA